MTPAAVNAGRPISEKPPVTRSALTTRIITGTVLASSLVLATLLLSEPWYALLLVAFVLVGAWEWAGIAGWPSTPARLAYCAASVPVLGVAGWLTHSTPGTLALLACGLVWWLVALAWVVRVQQGGDLEALDSPLARIVVGWLVLVPSWGAVVSLHSVPVWGAPMVLYLLLLVATADTAAYFVGRGLGRRRLASRVSPGKSLEGAGGALVAVAVLALAVSLLADVGAPAGFVALSLATALASILGDLTESAFKRRAGVKDSGSIVPGHGGILDRLDSITAAAPVFVLGLIVQGSVP